MTNILAFEASTETCSVALLRENSTELRLSNQARAHAQNMLPMVNQLLFEADLSLKQLSAVALGVGPGSFTGLRIAASFAQGISYGADIPIIRVKSFDAMAHGECADTVLDVKQSGLGNGEYTFLLTVLDARMGQLYWQVFEIAHQTYNPLVEPQLSTAEHLIEDIETKNFPLEKMRVVGNGVCCIKPEWLARCHSSCQKKLPLADAVAKIAFKKWEKGESTTFFDVEPLYLRNSVAWNKRIRIRE